ncbi:hypothetical protein BDB00DRAFT_233402 [Zychaea mexicana]|uniref:uncharacterized protein n=1 Tax=Zychaea mexicana TaxID=64656 RepID=UPI0022FE142E|nr:uncharacterized protein BDB00DRAFT_233402 [Zychaea mexicana]KAI9499418.1 hypothetical protein BDB00DRAFT_233402 [Zychaea mexicana]
MSDTGSDVDWEELFGPAVEITVETCPAIPGLKLAREAITHEEQMTLLQAITDHRYFHDDVDQGMCFGTLPAHFAWLEPWVKTMCSELFPENIVSRTPLFDQAIINLYQKGKGIKSHIDLLRFDDGILVVSLLSSCVMTMQKDSRKIPVLLRPGDVLALSGEARYQWEHGIEERMVDSIDGELIKRGTRVSVTLRKLLVTS